MTTREMLPGRPARNRLCRAAASAITAVLATVALSAPADPPLAPQRQAAGASAIYDRAAVAADHPLASQAGLEILKAGGNAVDAAVAVSFTLSVVRPESCGIGGGGFMVIHLDQDPRYGTINTAINYREQCPKAIGPDYFTQPENAAPDASTHGAKAVAVPGTVAGLLYALEKYGTMDRGKVLAPAIRAARSGFVADEHTVASAQEVRRWLVAEPTRRGRFRFTWDRFCAGGELKIGDRISLPEQARALELIAERGAGAFYFGDIARALVAAVSDDGGALSLGDLGAYQVREVDPLAIKFAGRTLYCMPPPSSGGLALAQTLGILERLKSPLADHPAASVEATHLVAEAMKHAFADRARWLGDPRFVTVPVDRLLSDEYLRERAALVSPAATLALDQYGTGPKEEELPRDGGTSHFSVLDERGNAVACTETVNLTFGSLLAVREFGFVLNNQMDDFLTRPGEANAFGLTQSRRNLPEPGKRPLSSMSPTIALSDAGGQVEMVVGASGGPRIITATAQAVIRALVYGASASDATGLPRFHTQWMPDKLWLEDDLLDRTQREELAARGHKVFDQAPSAACQVILRRNGHIEAACDPRKGGSPSGY